MKKTTLALYVSAFVAAACGSATSVDAALATYCDRDAACIGTATSEEIAACKKKNSGFDKQLKTECVSAYAQYYECEIAFATCTNKVTSIDQAKVAASCKTAADQAVKCQPLPDGFPG